MCPEAAPSPGHPEGPHAGPARDAIPPNPANPLAPGHVVINLNMTHFFLFATMVKFPTPSFPITSYHYKNMVAPKGPKPFPPRLSSFFFPETDFIFS